ncbi:MAG: hypothetical protein WC520_03730 [Candidatus Paceibacterota bacterium]
MLEILSNVVLVIIQEWNPKRGFGFVRLRSGRRAFVHVSELRPCPPCGTDLTGYEIDEQSFQVVETEKGLQLENVRIILPTVWSLEGGVIVSEATWPQSNRTERGLYPIVYRSRGKPPRYDQQRVEMAIRDGCLPEIISKVKSYYESLTDSKK